MISLQGINKYYITGDEKIHALRDVDLEIKKGEFIAVMGPSGSGKSTMIKILGLLDNNFQGEYFFDGKNVRTLNDDQLSTIRNNKIGFVFQNFNLIKTLTIKENIYLPMLYKGASKKQCQERALSLLRRVDLESKTNKYVSELSGGQQQRVAIIRALVNNPDIIIADEPTGALDSHTSKDIMNLFQELNKEGITIIVITHDKDVAKEAKRIVNIFDGELKEDAV
ncbi:ABC transporter ATP-binding protein [Alloiococcus sp. CFN-8]|uniref:ABC transporter ATP-binding protein n=1 Tax=Alloiococcus sp. CFN-8 TaxID=3416081 RepID=UPI003CFB6084